MLLTDFTNSQYLQFQFQCYSFHLPDWCWWFSYWTEKMDSRLWWLFNSTLFCCCLRIWTSIGRRRQNKPFRRELESIQSHSRNYIVRRNRSYFTYDKDRNKTLVQLEKLIHRSNNFVINQMRFLEVPCPDLRICRLRAWEKNKQDANYV